MGGWPVEGKRLGIRGVLLTSDSSDSEEERSGTSEGIRPTGFAETDAAAAAAAWA
jgi:hypothetical protein